MYPIILPNRNILLLGIVLSFLVSPFSAAADSGSGQSFGRGFPPVDVADHRLRVKVNDIPRETLLREIAERASIRIVVHGRIEDSVTVDFSDVPLEMGVKQLTRGLNHAFIYDSRGTKTGTPEIVAIFIFPEDPGLGVQNRDITFGVSGDMTGEMRPDDILALTFKALEDEYPVTREEAVGTLAKYRDDRAFTRLTEVLLQDEDEDVRAGAARALGEFGDMKAIDPLLTALQDREVWVRENAVTALGKIGEENAMAALDAVLGDEDEDVKSAAAVAIKVIEERLSKRKDG